MLILDILAFGETNAVLIRELLAYRDNTSLDKWPFELVPDRDVL